VVATDFGRPLDVLQDNIAPLDGSFAQAQPEASKESAPVLESSSADVSIAPTNNAVDTAAPEVIIPPLVEPTPVTTKKSNYLPSSKGKEWGPSATLDSPVSSSSTDTISTARVALAETADKADISGATITNSADDDLIAKYFVTPPDPPPTAQAKPNGSGKERSTKNRDTSGLQMTKGESTVVEAPMETKDFDALELITQQSFLEQIRYENTDMAKARRTDEDLELFTVESKEPAMVAGTEVKLDTKVNSKKAEKKQKDKMKPAIGFGKTKPAIGSQERKSFRGKPAEVSIAPTNNAVDAAVTEVMIPPSVVPTPFKTKKSKYGKKRGPSSTASSSASESSTTDTVSTPTLAVTIDEADTSSGDSDVVLSQSKVTPQARDSPLVVENKKASSDEAKQRALLMARLEQERRQKEKGVETKKASFEEARHRALLMARLQQEQRQREVVSSQRNEDPTPDRQSAVTLARKQPKSPEEEKKLEERYGSMPLQERAFAVLYDLGMIEKNLKSDDPEYDHSNDDEVFL
jgi:hypothetical protein